MTDFHRLTVMEIRRETDDAVSIGFAVPTQLREAFRYRPGQYLTLRTTTDGEEVRRTYSICSGPDDALLRIAVKRVPGGAMSNWINEVLRTDDSIDVMPPIGRFVLPPADTAPRHIVGFAAGSGITPIMSIVQHALRDDPTCRVTLVYGNRSVGSIIFRQALEDLKDRYLARFRLIHVLSRNDDVEAPMLQGRIDAEKVEHLIKSQLRAADVTHAFLCGPGSMIKDVRKALFDLGVPREQVHHEFFAAGGGAFRKPPPVQSAAPPSPVEALPHEIVAILDGTRHVFGMRDGEHVIDAALRAGVKVPYSCKGGMCCTCRARVVDGSVTMTMNYSLEPWEIEKGFVLTCQAVPTSPRLVLDYDAL
jgi:ring-1,2-phenylacetyl-CoA epoxidase subunit PaaE